MSSLIWVWASARDCSKNQRQACPCELHMADNIAKQSRMHRHTSMRTQYRKTHEDEKRKHVQTVQPIFTGLGRGRVHG